MDLVKKKYVCNVCKYRGAILNAVKDNRDITSEFLKEYVEPLGEISPITIYTYEVNRDEEGMLLNRKPVQCLCEHCNTVDIVYTPDQEFKNVLNFYGPAEPEKWYRGFNELGKS